MRITAKVVLDSTCMRGHRITTLMLEYPRYIHAELMTHRVFSRNAGSSRATPVEAMIKMVLDDPAFFLHVGLNRPGMQAKEQVSDLVRQQFQDEWETLCKINCEYVRRWTQEYHIHKQVANRALEPWAHIRVLVTATEWHNFFELRDHPDAMPEICELAQQVKRAMNESVAKELDYDDWHLPYVQEEDRRVLNVLDLLKVSTARCARVSYMNHDGTKPDVDKDIALHDMLVAARPRHASPSEHQARPTTANPEMFPGPGWRYAPSRNFTGWVPYRYYLEEEPATLEGVYGRR